MENEKIAYEEPTVAMVEFDFRERIVASFCGLADHPSNPCGHDPY